MSLNGFSEKEIRELTPEKLKNYNENELKILRKQLAIMRSSIDRKLDSQAYGDMDEDEAAQLDEAYEFYGKIINNIDKLINTKKR